MSTGAHVDSIDALKSFRVALIKFAEEANVALATAESELQRTIGWLERDQLSFWQMQIRKRQELLGRAQEALRMKKLFPDASGRFPTPIEEEKAVRRAKAILEEAEQKLANTKRWGRTLQREAMNYKGGVARLSTWVGSEVPVAISRLDRMVSNLEAYVALRAPGGYSPVRDASAEAFRGAPVGGGMTRAADEAPKTEPESALSDARFPVLTEGQAAVLHAEPGTGAALTPDGRPYGGEGDKYVAFGSVEEARQYCGQKAGGGATMECMIFDARGRVLERVGPRQD